MISQHFAPGGSYRSNTIRVKDLYNTNDVYCLCLKEKSKKYEADPPVNPNLSTNMKVSNWISQNLGNCYNYTDNTNKINYLGRIQGMPGGYGTPIRNRFN